MKEQIKQIELKLIDLKNELAFLNGQLEKLKSENNEGSEECAIPENIVFSDIGGDLGLQFGDNQLLFYERSDSKWKVFGSEGRLMINSQLKLVPCKYETIKPGDWFVVSPGLFRDIPNLKILGNYRLRLNNNNNYCKIMAGMDVLVFVRNIEIGNNFWKVVKR